MRSNSSTLPVSLEQVALLIKRMHPQQRQKLITMVPELMIDTLMHKESNDNVNQIVQDLKEELLEVVGEQPVSSDETFLGGFTLREYLELSEEERNNLWDQWSMMNINDLEEIKVHSDALPA